MERERDLDLTDGTLEAEPPVLLIELLLDELLSSPCNAFCLAASSEFNKLSAWSLKCSEKPQKALKKI